MTVMDWDRLHREERHQLHYPSEEVVRFLAATRKDGAQDFLDIGCGAGRHMKLAGELGLSVIGTDSSREAVMTAAEFGETDAAPMTDLPYSDNEFDAALLFGTAYYAAFPELKAAVSEMHRVLRPGGLGLLSLRTTNDYRYGLGEPLSWYTFRLAMPGEPEDGSVVTFLPSVLVPPLFGEFSGAFVELQERTTHNRLRWESDWIVTVRK